MSNNNESELRELLRKPLHFWRGYYSKWRLPWCLDEMSVVMLQNLPLTLQQLCIAIEGAPHPGGFHSRRIASQVLSSLLITWGSFQVSLEKARDSELLTNSQAIQMLQLHRLLSGKWWGQQGYKQQPLKLSNGCCCIREVGILWYGQSNENWFSLVRDLVICEGMLLNFQSENRFRELNFNFLDDIGDFKMNLGTWY